ncbi:DNA polymerase III subunit delta' [Colwellia sp. D2M02]|uniref:DNA polymerase III subunit delta' n=1 Tax=Colwellia sp. D2M02 TaxID=2841562 RepID=UPI001C0A29A6|nr:DNA polymerase III subunit delta' [Colwellia sp. D2M02]MBU2892590.1 DNA polymerase III subunit delta' [Colwellia sp. D2M02]
MISNKVILTQQFIQQRLPHAILITGAQGAGKKELGEWLSQLLLCQSPQKVFVNDDQDYYLQACRTCKHCQLKHSHSYPDHLMLTAQNTSIGVDDVRQANYFLEKTAHIGHYKTLLIPHAEIMTVAAANALLKTLEEPTKHSIIMLLTHDSDMLLPTIISRCRLVHIQPLVGDKLLSKVNYPLNDENANFVNLTHLPELSNESTHQAYKLFKHEYLALLNHEKSESTLLTLLQDNSEALRWLEKITTNLQRDLSVNADTLFLTNKGISIQSLYDIYQLTIKASKTIKLYPQGNKAFILEELLMSITQIVTSSLITEQAKD